MLGEKNELGEYEYDYDEGIAPWLSLKLILFMTDKVKQVIVIRKDNLFLVIWLLEF
jgi:hypothetical protein